MQRKNGKSDKTVKEKPVCILDQIHNSEGRKCMGPANTFKYVDTCIFDYRNLLLACFLGFSSKKKKGRKNLLLIIL